MRLFIQLKFAWEDIVSNIKWFIILCIGLGATMVGLSFVLFILFGYEINRIPMLNAYIENDLTKVTTIDSPYMVDNELTKDYILSFVEENKEIVMLSFYEDKFINSIEGQAFIGMGCFEKFYDISGNKNGDNLTYNVYGNKDISFIDNIDFNINNQALYYISTAGRYLVLPMHEIFVTGDVNDFVNMGIKKVSVRSLLSNFIFVNADKNIIDAFVRKINSFNPELKVYTEDMSKELHDTVIGESFKQLSTFGTILFLMLIGFYIGIMIMLNHVNERNIKSLTINLLSGAQIKEIFLRLFFQNFVVVFVSFILSILVTVIIQIPPMLPYIAIQSLIYIVLFPVLPMAKLKKLLNQDNLG